jgi:hypothetical protein
MGDNEPKKYTLVEAARILARQRCMMYGHTDLTDFRFEGIIRQIVCGDCGMKYVLEEDEEGSGSIRNQNP